MNGISARVSDLFEGIIPFFEGGCKVRGRFVMGKKWNEGNEVR